MQNNELGEKANFWSKPWKLFKYYITANAQDEPIFLATRQNLGSYVAFIMAIYNTFLLKQKILKNSIFITKSNNPIVIVSASIFVGAFYFTGLACLWHIPSFFCEIAARVYSAT